jgi:uncharacterized protein
MPYDAPDLSRLTLADIATLVAARKLPPVGEWHPERSGDSEMRIASDGRWFHQGGEITRPAMIRAFSSVLRVDENGQHWLVTPHERLAIIVDDAPFLAVELQSSGIGVARTLTFRLNSDDLVIAGPDHELALRGDLPYLHVRQSLWAKLSRSVYYQLAEWALDENPDQPGLWSENTFFAIGPA